MKVDSFELSALGFQLSAVSCQRKAGCAGGVLGGCAGGGPGTAGGGARIKDARPGMGGTSSMRDPHYGSGMVLL